MKFDRSKFAWLKLGRLKSSWMKSGRHGFVWLKLEQLKPCWMKSGRLRFAQLKLERLKSDIQLLICIENLLFFFLLFLRFSHKSCAPIRWAQWVCLLSFPKLFTWIDRTVGFARLNSDIVFAKICCSLEIETGPWWFCQNDDTPYGQGIWKGTSP